MEKQEKLDFKKSFCYLAGIFLIVYFILFALSKVFFRFVVGINQQTTSVPLQIFVNSMILALSSAIGWTISMLVFSKKDFSEEILKDLIKYLFVFIVSFALLHLIAYSVISAYDIVKAKQKLDELKNSLSKNVVYEYAKFANTITTTSGYTFRKVLYSSISFMSLLVTNLGAILIITRVLHLKCNPHLKKEKPKKEFFSKLFKKKEEGKQAYKIQQVEDKNQPVQNTQQPQPVQQNVEKQEKIEQKSEQKTEPEKKPTYEIQQVEMNTVKKE